MRYAELVTGLARGDHRLRRAASPFGARCLRVDPEPERDADRGWARPEERNRAVVLQEQTRGAIEGAARLKGEIIAAEVQLQVTRNFAKKG